MRNGAIAALLVVAILAGAGAGYIAGNGGEHEITSTFSTVSTAYLTTTLTTTTGVTQYENQQFIYLTSNGLCKATGPNATQNYVPCFGSPAFLLNACPNLLAGPPSPFTCSYSMRVIVSPYPTVRFNITLGVVGQSMEPTWANCKLEPAISASYIDCIPIGNSTAFIVGVPSPPPP